MELLQLESTKSTPHIRFDPEKGILLMEGQAYPENSTQFFEPILSWIEAFLGETKDPVVLDATLTYLNTSSSKAMMMILDLLEDAYVDGLDVKVYWRFHSDNEMGEEYGMDFSEDLSLPFELIVIK